VAERLGHAFPAQVGVRKLDGNVCFQGTQLRDR